MILRIEIHHFATMAQFLSKTSDLVPYLNSLATGSLELVFLVPNFALNVGMSRGS